MIGQAAGDGRRVGENVALCFGPFGDAVVLVPEADLSIGGDVDDDPLARVGRRAGCSDRELLVAEADGIVIAHGAGEMQAQDVGELLLGRRGAEGGNRETGRRWKMRYVMCAAIAMALICAAGCVKVDLGQASKDWSNVGKGFADGYKAQGAQRQGAPASPQAPAAPQPAQ